MLFFLIIVSFTRLLFSAGNNLGRTWADWLLSRPGHNGLISKERMHGKERSGGGGGGIGGE